MKMSIHTLSDLAVQDISDESAAVHSGGVTFIWYNDKDGLVPSGTDSWLDNEPVGHRVQYGLIGNSNNNLESFKMTDAQPGRTYLVEFFDGNDGATNKLGDFKLTSAKNGLVQALAPKLRNKASSLVITRIPG